MLFLEYDEKKIREYDRRDGRIEGRKEINDLHALLLSEGKIDVLKRAVVDPEYQEKLLKEYFPDRVSETE